MEYVLVQIGQFIELLRRPVHFFRRCVRFLRCLADAFLPLGSGPISINAFIALSN